MSREKQPPPQKSATPFHGPTTTATPLPARARCPHAPVPTRPGPAHSPGRSRAHAPQRPRLLFKSDQRQRAAPRGLLGAGRSRDAGHHGKCSPGGAGPPAPVCPRAAPALRWVGAPGAALQRLWCRCHTGPRCHCHTGPPAPGPAATAGPRLPREGALAPPGLASPARSARTSPLPGAAGG